MRYLGVDPGVTGAFATLDVAPDGTQVVAVTAIPTEWRGKRRAYDIRRLHELVMATKPVTLAYLEQQGARPGQGVVSMFSTGQGYGLWQALLTVAEIPFVVVSPVRWRGVVGLRTTGKQPKQDVKKAVRLAASRRFPALPITLAHADAVMLAVAAALEHGVK